MPNLNIGTSRQKLNELLGQRADFIAAAETALNAANRTEYQAQMAKAKALDAQIKDLQDLVSEYDKYDIDHAPAFGSGRQDLQAMGEHLMAGERVKFQPNDVLGAIRRNSLTYSGSLVTPTGGGSDVNDGVNAQVSTLVNQVRTEVFRGMSAWEEAYLKSIQTASGGKVATVAGTARAATDPVFKKAKLLATEIQVTSYVDKNIQNLSPTDYAAKVQQYALKALLRKANAQVVNGDALSNHEMFGILNGTNTDAEAIYQTMAGVTAIDKDTLRKLVFGYGGDEEVASQCRLILSKASLDKFGQITIGDTDNRKLYEITSEGNTGVIKEGGLTVPYTISSAIGDSKLAYGDPMGYLLGLFGDYSIRIDTSVKSVERMITILGDALIGGNLVSDKAFAIATLAASSQPGPGAG